MYAILDIETTGGKYNEEGITEIAIYQHDGLKVTDQFISLVNPERAIQPFVEKLTGINGQMLRNAPRFFEIAKRIIEITENCLIVAHNTDFDYRILRTEFKRLGYNFERNSLCTISLSQQLLPDMESYKLGKLVRSLGIPISDRHRAQGDAMATVKLFELLLEKDSNKQILKSQIKALHTYQVPSKYLSIIEELPTATGVYYLYNAVGDLLYIGKSEAELRSTLFRNMNSIDFKGDGETGEYGSGYISLEPVPSPDQPPIEQPFQFNTYDGTFRWYSFAIHGSNDLSRIGKAVTGGCINAGRFTMEALLDRVQLGDQVEISSDSPCLP